jgi:hypothetical protein
MCSIHNKNYVFYMPLLHAMLDVKHVIGSVDCVVYYRTLTAPEQENTFRIRKEQNT